MKTFYAAFLVVLATSLFIVGCPGKPSPFGPSSSAAAAPASSASVFSAMSTPNPKWTGTTTPNDHSAGGTLTVVFSNAPTNSAGTVTWTGPTGTYTGAVSGTYPSHVIVTATSIATGCVYTATGTVTVTPSSAVAPGSIFSGQYTKSGEGSCIDKSGSGTFTLTQGAPTPDACDATFAITGPATGIVLSNSNPTTELAYVKAHVSQNLVLSGNQVTSGFHPSTDWTADANYAAVLIKAGDEYALFVNVVAGHVYQSQSFNSHKDRQDISHVTRFACSVSVQ